MDSTKIGAVRRQSKISSPFLEVTGKLGEEHGAS